MESTIGCNGISSIQKSVQESKDFTFLNLLYERTQVRTKMYAITKCMYEKNFWYMSNFIHNVCNFGSNVIHILGDIF